jgi:F0F1-type ATP synthase delta subunit
MEKVKGSEQIDQMVALLNDWQKLELQALETTAKIIHETANPVIREIMQIIRNDSLQHHRVQQFIIDSFTKQAVSLTPEDLSQIWRIIEEHDAIEKRTIGLAQKLTEQCRFPVQKALLKYLLADEQKHEELFQHLGEVKKGMYPYGS